MDIEKFINDYETIKELILNNLVVVLDNYHLYYDYNIVSFYFDSSNNIHVEYSYLRKGYIETNVVNFPSKYLNMSNDEIKLDIEFLKNEEIRLKIHAEKLAKQEEYDADMIILKNIQKKYGFDENKF